MKSGKHRFSNHRQEGQTASWAARGADAQNLIACVAVLAYNMYTYELEAPEHAKELRLPFERQALGGGLG